MKKQINNTLAFVGVGSNCNRYYAQRIIFGFGAKKYDCQVSEAGLFGNGGVLGCRL